MQVMGCYNNIGITVIIIIHVIDFKEWQDDSMALIRENIKTQHGNYQMTVVFWSVYGVPSWLEGHSNCISVFFFTTVLFTYTNEEYSDMYLFIAFAMGVEMQQEQNTKEISK